MSQLYVDNIKNRDGGAIAVPSGAIVTGVVTATTFKGNVEGTTGTFSGNVSVDGLLTYDDVANVDSIGIVTAQSGIRVGAGESIGSTTSTENVVYYGDGSKLTGVESGVSNFIASGTISNGAPVVVNVDGTIGAVEQTGSGGGAVGTPVTFDTGALNLSSVYETTANKTVVIYRDYADSSKGKSVVATISGDAVTFGSPSTFSNRAIKFTSLAYDPDTNRVIAHYMDDDNGDYPTWCVGELSGTSVSWGSPASYYSNYAEDVATVYDTTNNKIVLIWNNTQSGELRAVTGDVRGGSNNDLQLGSTQEIANSSNTADNVDDSNKGYYSVGTYTATNTQTWSSIAAFTTGAIDSLSAVYDSNLERIIVAYRDTSNSNYGTAVVGSLSGDTITWGSPVVFCSGDAEVIRATYDSFKNRVVIAFKDASNSDYGTYVTGAISGGYNRTITFTAKQNYKAGTTSGQSINFDTNAQKSLIAYSQGISSDSQGVTLSVTTSTTNLTAENYIGIAAEAISNGATGKVNIMGGVNSGQTGLTTARTYYVQGDGTLATSADTPSVVAGTSISETEILIR